MLFLFNHASSLVQEPDFHQQIATYSPNIIDHRPVEGIASAHLAPCQVALRGEVNDEEGFCNEEHLGAGAVI